LALDHLGRNRGPDLRRLEPSERDRHICEVIHRAVIAPESLTVKLDQK